MNKQTETNISAIRGISAVLIMIYHYSVYFDEYISPIEFKHFNFAYLTFAVPLFFIFSSFFLYEKAIHYHNPVKLFVYRLARLYPMYWIAVLFSSCVLIIGGEQLSLKQILLNLTMIEKLFGVEHIDGAYWTLFYELMLLLILSIVSFIYSKKLLTSSTLSFCISWMVLGAFSSLFMKLKNIDSSVVAVLLFACRYVPVFVMGIVFFDRYRNQGREISRKWYIYLYVSSILYELFLAQSISHGIFGIIAILIANCCLSGKLNHSRLFSAKPLVFLGGISYNLYLCHNQFGKVLIRKLGTEYHLTVLPAIFLIIGIGVLAIGIAFIFSKLEKKLIRMINRYTGPFLAK